MDGSTDVVCVSDGEGLDGGFFFNHQGWPTAAEAYSASCPVGPGGFLALAGVEAVEDTVPEADEVNSSETGTPAASVLPEPATNGLLGSALAGDAAPAESSLPEKKR
ncbi:unnamed protein product [Prorocentrum cordatum]|uniref:Subtilisin n=1 Tax=Prorocentrum cordatum TaxID=2364126 RepID=A0ABN9X6T1_9DINO|nr:unnamed protein product [Polarella glacialis]